MFSDFECRENVPTAVEFFNPIEDIVRELVRVDFPGICDFRIGVAIRPCRLSVERVRKKCLRLPERLKWSVPSDVSGRWIGVSAVDERPFY